MQNKIVDVYDLDGTILAGNSFHLYMAFLAKTFVRRGDVVGLTGIFTAVSSRLLKRVSHYQLKNRILELAGRVPAKDHQKFAETLASSCRQRLRILEEKRAGAERVRVLATAAPSIYAVHTGKLLGFQHVISSEIRENTLVETIAARKLQAVQSLATERNLTVDCFFTDHHDDVFCAQIASRVILVDPSEKTVEEFARRNFEFSVHRFPNR